MLRRTALAMMVVVGAGCGSSSGGGRDGGTGAGARDGGRDSTFNPFDAPVTGAAGSAGGTTGTAGGSGIDAPPVDRGMPNPGALVYQGVEAFMLGDGPSCTEEAGATGDRWCAFVAASPTLVDVADLYVFNATRAAAGTAITCGGAAADPNCLKLTGDFARDTLHGAFFGGDTLVYFDATATPFGWRPGMTAGRALVVANTMAGEAVLGCIPASKGNAIVCLKDLATQTNANIIISDLMLGTLDGAATPPLARVESVISFNTGDGDAPRFAYAFMADGLSLAWSTRITATGAEVLKTQRVGDDASRAVIGSDIHEWSVSPDRTHWSWFTQYNVNTGAGTLQSAVFPAGTAPVGNGSNVVQYGFPNARAVVSVTTAGAMSGLAEPLTAPGTAAAIDTGVLAYFDLSSQGDIAYAKNYNSNLDEVDMHVKRWNATGAPCTLTATTNGAYQAFLFTPGGGAAVWARDTGNARFELLLTRLSDCMTMPITPPGAFFVDASSDRAVIYMEGLEPTRTGSLWFRPLAADGSALGADPTYVSSGVGSFSSLAAAPGALVYSVNTGGTADGIYVRSGP